MGNDQNVLLNTPVENIKWMGASDGTDLLFHFDGSHIGVWKRDPVQGFRYLTYLPVEKNQNTWSFWDFTSHCVDTMCAPWYSGRYRDIRLQEDKDLDAVVSLKIQVEGDWIKVASLHGTPHLE